MSKRLNGEGTIYKNTARNRWEGQFQCVINGKKCRKKVTGKNRREVKEKAEIIKLKMKADTSDIITISEWLEKWLNTYVRGHVKIKTQERYELAVYKHIIPCIGNSDIKKITPLEIQKFINSLYENGGENGTGLSPRTVNSARTILSSAFKQAVGADIIEKNPVVFTKPIKAERTNIHILKKYECQKIVSSAKKETNQSFWIAIVIALETGLRKGEIFGLRWSDIDFEKKCLSVNRTVVTGNHGIQIQNSAKTKSSRRTIDITEMLIKQLLKYRSWQNWYLSNISNVENKPDEFLITSEKGTLKDPNSFTYVVFKRILRNAGVSEEVRFHDLRHTHATQLLKAGVDIKTVSERLGHTNIRITLDTYTHVLPSMKDNLITKLSGLNLAGL